MDLRFTKEQEALREEIRGFLKANPPETFPTQGEDSGFGMGAWSDEFSRALAGKGWVSIDWPKEYGGQGLGLIERLILQEELAYRRAPAHSTFFSGDIAYKIIERGNERLRRELLPGIARGEIGMFMGFSEPEAGSDLLALKTQAAEDGDYFVINGGKIWSGNAHLAQYGTVLAMTDPKAEKRHKGLSFFIVEKALPGVTVQPIISMAGHHLHNQVFFDNVRVHKDYLLGGKNKGFDLLLSGLDADRFWGRFPKAPFCKGVFEDILTFVREAAHARPTSPIVRHELADRHVEIEACRLYYWYIGWLMSKGEAKPTRETAAAKVFADEMGQRLFKLGVRIFAGYSNLRDERWASLKRQVEFWYMMAFGHTIAGGTSEIARNTVATLGLGLPRS